MTQKKAYTVTDLGGGDGGKGGVVHKLCALRRPHTVVKVGGAQGSHGVSTNRGEKFNFSQFGCGTFNGAHTFISDRFVLSPIGILNEAHALRYEQCVSDPFSLITVDGNALCTTPFHGIGSRLRELARKENPRGIVGVGVGEAYLDAIERYPEEAIYARDLIKSDLRDRLRASLNRKLFDLAQIFEMDFMTEDGQRVKEEIDLIRNEEFFEWVVEHFTEFAKRVKIVDADYFQREVLSRDGIIVIESSHGVITDRFHGFHPHTTRLRTVPEVLAWSLLREHEYDGQIVKLGVTRAYQIRHGAGPLVVDDPAMAFALLPEEVGNPDRYRGKVRVGPLDMVALRYALDVCGGAESFDGLAVTWFDYVSRAGQWKICDRYECATSPEFFTSSGEIRVLRGTDNKQLGHQERLARALGDCRPHVVDFPVHPGTTQEDLIALCSRVLVEQLGVPVRMMSFGPTESGKVCF